MQRHEAIGTVAFSIIVLDAPFSPGPFLFGVHEGLIGGGSISNAINP